MLSNSKNHINIHPNHTIPNESGLLFAIKHIEDHDRYVLFEFSPMKYIDRMQMEPSKPIKVEKFNNFCDILTNHARFMVESVRWRRLDEYLAVIGATFVRFRPVEE